MRPTDTPRPPPAGPVWDRDTLEFARVVNLSDAVFAIAMTLLVLGLEVPRGAGARAADALAGVVPSLVAFVLAFGLVANIWWQHHRLFARLGRVDRGMIVLNLVLLGAVALVPFPTGLLGVEPASRAAVLPFIGTFAVLLVLFIALTARAQRTGAWLRPIPAHLYGWVLAGWLIALAGVVVAAAVAVAWPVAGLVTLVLSNLPQTVLERRAPAGYGDWA